MEDLSYFIILKVDNTSAYPTRLPNLDGVNFLLMNCQHVTIRRSQQQQTL